jgi:hypothetical protein
VSAAVFTLGCKNGHKVDVTEDRAREIIYSACDVCYSPLFVKKVRTTTGSQKTGA